MDHLAPFLIPIIALSIPLVAVTGKVIVRPIVDAISRHADAQRAAQVGVPAEEIQHLEARLTRLERTLRHVVEEQEFMHQLYASSGSPRPLSTGTPPPEQPGNAP